MKLQHVIALTLVFLLGSTSLLMGTLVLLGLYEPDHTVLEGLLVYNIILGILSLLVVLIIWKQSRSTQKFVYLMLFSHTTVLAYLVFFVNDIAHESIRAMEIRAVAWALVFFLIQWDSLKNGKVSALLPWKKTTLILFLSATFVSGCKQPPKEQKTVPHNPNQIRAEEDTPTTSVADSGWTNEIQLDHQTRWSANPETTIGVTKMLRTIQNYKGGTVSEHRKLGNELNEMKNYIVKECTMTGPSHDNLHIWLHPLIKKIEALQKVDDKKTGIQLIQDIEHHVTRYHDFFE